MTEDAVMSLLLDLIRNTDTITDIVGANGVRAAMEETPSVVPCIYYGENIEGELDEQWSDGVIVQFECFHSSRSGAWNLAGAVDGVLNVRADTNGLDDTIRANHPNVLLYSIFKSSSLGQSYPTKNGIEIYSVLLRYEIRGRYTG